MRSLDPSGLVVRAVEGSKVEISDFHIGIARALQIFALSKANLKSNLAIHIDSNFFYLVWLLVEGEQGGFCFSDLFWMERRNTKL